MAAYTDCIDDAEKFSSDVTNGDAVMVVNLCQVRLVQAGHAGGLVEGGTQRDAATFTHFDFAADEDR